MMLAANPSKPKNPKTNNMKSLSKFFKKQGSKFIPAPDGAAGGDDAKSQGSGGKRKSRQRVKDFVQSKEGSGGLLWRDTPNGEDVNGGDVTSEESASSMNFSLNAGVNSHSTSSSAHMEYSVQNGSRSKSSSKNGGSPKLHQHKSCPALTVTQEEEQSRDGSHASTGPPSQKLLPSQSSPKIVKKPRKKGVRFCNPIVSFKVEIESSWDIFPGPQVDTKDKTKATLLDGYMSMHGVDFRLIGYDRQQVVDANRKEKQYLPHDVLMKLRTQKERLAKYRRKLKKKQRKAREDRCQIKGRLAYECIAGVQARHDRIIARYKMAAPNAVEHRRRRHVKFVLAREAKVIVQVQTRQNFLFAIREGAYLMQEKRKRAQKASNKHNKHFKKNKQGGSSSIRHQMRRIAIHQASMKALMRLQRKGLLLYEVTCDPIIHEMKPPAKTVYDLDESSDEDSSDDESEYEYDDDYDTDDWNYRRLEWAQISFLAAAKSKHFLKGQAEV